MANPMIALILKHHGDGEAEPHEDDGDGDEGASGWEAAAHDLVECVKSGDLQGVCDAFKALHDLAHAEMDEGEDGEGGEEGY